MIFSQLINSSPQPTNQLLFKNDMMQSGLEINSVTLSEIQPIDESRILIDVSLQKGNQNQSDQCDFTEKFYSQNEVRVESKNNLDYSRASQTSDALHKSLSRLRDEATWPVKDKKVEDVSSEKKASYIISPPITKNHLNKGENLDLIGEMINEEESQNFFLYQMSLEHRARNQLARLSQRKENAVFFENVISASHRKSKSILQEMSLIKSVESVECDLTEKLDQQLNDNEIQVVFASPVTEAAEENKKVIIESTFSNLQIGKKTKFDSKRFTKENTDPHLICSICGLAMKPYERKYKRVHHHCFTNQVNKIKK